MQSHHEKTGVADPSRATQSTDDTREERIIDGWKVAEQLGTGSFGDVYRVRHLETEREGALKLFDEHLETGANSGGYLTELELLFDAHHPNLVEILSFGYTSGRKYIVYEYVGGGNLRDFLVRHNRISPRTALELLAEAGRGLAFAHDHDIVHRDLKPENLLLTDSSWPCTIKLCDFGLSARAAPEQRLEASYGSPAYMAPEQLEGDYDHRADFYAFGVMLYEMLFGRRPLTGDASAIAHAHEHVGLPLPESGSPELRRVLQKMLASDPDDRYERAETMVADLDRARDSVEREAPASSLSEPESEQLELDRDWTARLTGRAASREGTRDGSLLLAIGGHLVELTSEGRCFEHASVPPRRVELLAGGTATETIGWRSGDRMTLLEEETRHTWELDEAIIDGTFDLVISPTGRSVAAITGEIVRLYDLDGRVRWQASLETHDILPSFAFGPEGECVWLTSEAPRTQLHCLEPSGDPVIRTAAPDHEVALCGGADRSACVLGYTDSRVCRVTDQGYIESDLEVFGDPLSLHRMRDTYIGLSGSTHLEVIDSSTMESRALVRYPAPEEPVLVTNWGVYQMSEPSDERATLVEHWSLEPVT